VRKQKKILRKAKWAKTQITKQVIHVRYRQKKGNSEQKNAIRTRIFGGETMKDLLHSACDGRRKRRLVVKGVRHTRGGARYTLQLPPVVNRLRVLPGIERLGKEKEKGNTEKRSEGRRNKREANEMTRTEERHAQ
jgi:hypothetical protein